MLSETRQVLIGWIRIFGLAMLVYLAALATAIWASSSVAAGPLRTALILAPILPGLALIGLTVRSYRLCDEYIRLRTLRAAAIAVLMVAVFSLIYSFLELLGLPRLSAAWFSNIVWLVFVAQMARLIATGK
jgi:hypothetical protein